MKYALIGEKLVHSFSKTLHTKYFEAKGEDSTYDLAELKKECFGSEFKDFIEKGCDGFNVTIPYKKTVMPYLDEISPEAKKIGAVNTVKIKDGRLYGYNTDFYGILKTFERFEIEIKTKRVCILGTGGASAAVYSACAASGAKEVFFVSRSRKNHCGTVTKTYSDKLEGDVLINATPVGMYPDTEKCPVEKTAIEKGGFSSVFDLIYNPEKTMLLKNAEDIGIKAVNGLYMLVTQGIYAESIWKDIPFEDDVNEKIFGEVKDL